MGNCHIAGPNEVLVISDGARGLSYNKPAPGAKMVGGCCQGGNPRTKLIVGGWGWAWACGSNVQRLSLEVMTVNPRCETAAFTVTGVAQVKVLTGVFLEMACENFLGKSKVEMKNVILQALEEHFQKIIGELTFENICKERSMFARLIRQAAMPKLGRIGIEILSLEIKHIEKKVQHLDSSGKMQTGTVSRDADIGVAEADRDPGIRNKECVIERKISRITRDSTLQAKSRYYKERQEAECSKEMMDIKYSTQAKTADASQEYQMNRI